MPGPSLIMKNGKSKERTTRFFPPLRITGGAFLASWKPGSLEKGELLTMLYKFGRFLQLLGMIILPVAIAGNLAREDLIDLKTSLVLSGVGIAVFAVGWLIQQAGKKE
jgi:hypothetical protein